MVKTLEVSRQLILRHFKKADPILFSLFQKFDVKALVPSDDYFIDIVESIINQQLSDKAASTITERFHALFGKKPVTPRAVVRMPVFKIRSVGISGAKTVYIKSLAQLITDDELHLKNFDAYDDETVIRELTKIRGIGQWTAEMFLMFSLARPDVFSHTDAGLRRAIQKAYAIKGEIKDRTLLRLSKHWIPYRTYACRVLWRSLDTGD